MINPEKGGAEAYVPPTVPEAEVDQSINQGAKFGDGDHEVITTVTGGEKVETATGIPSDLDVRTSITMFRTARSKVRLLY